jgi:hypothetical protein
MTTRLTFEYLHIPPFADVRRRCYLPCSVAAITRSLKSGAEALGTELRDIDKATMSVPMRHFDLCTAWIGRVVVSLKRAA